MLHLENYETSLLYATANFCEKIIDAAGDDCSLISPQTYDAFEMIREAIHEIVYSLDVECDDFNGSWDADSDEYEHECEEDVYDDDEYDDDEHEEEDDDKFMMDDDGRITIGGKTVAYLVPSQFKPNVKDNYKCSCNDPNHFHCKKNNKRY